MLGVINVNKQRSYDGSAPKVYDTFDISPVTGTSIKELPISVSLNTYG